ncbi:hypothetical protein FLONG3_9748 [Fusarium longipes]|uniref:HNH nuclease domain-containing protein n=1 Tax=Fusarium longipes TaxID=694270 RepID=A0A395RV30_9HYPO|nr:hypothetical protein FLONG3_9748 [Fusarium longipes]
MDHEQSSAPKTCRRHISQEWDQEFSEDNLKELRLRQDAVREKLSSVRKHLKRKISMDMDDEYWDMYLTVSRLHIEQAKIDSQIGLEKSQKLNEDWYTTPAAEKHKLKFDSWSQWERLMSKHKSKIQKRMPTSRDAFARLFTTSKHGLDINVQDKRDKSVQANMGKAMVEAYCPDTGNPRNRWDPVLRRWGTNADVHAAHLYPWAQGPYMDDIFGEGTSDNDLFSPHNGLFLTTCVEDALEKGKLVIVPDVDITPADPHRPLDDLEARHERAKRWEETIPKEYKIIVLRVNDPKITATLPLVYQTPGVTRLLDLHDRKLEFITDARPRARYIWWTFLNAVLRVSWNSNSGDGNLQHAEARAATRYWGTRRQYVKRNQLLGFVEEIGHDVESILTDALETEEDNYDGAPRYEATQALVETAGVRTVRKMNELLAEEDPEEDEEGLSPYEESDESEDEDEDEVGLSPHEENDESEDEDEDGGFR